MRYLLFLFLLGNSFLMFSNERTDTTEALSLVVFISSAEHNTSYTYNNLDSIGVQNLLNRKKTEFIAQGYAEANIDSLRTSDDSVIVYYDLGGLYRWGSLTIDSLPASKSKEIKRILNLKDEQFDPYSIQEKIDKLLSYYENQGHPFCEVYFTNITIEAYEIHAKLKINQNPLILFDSIVVRGDTLLRYPFLKNYLGIYSGTAFSQKKIERASRYLDQLEFVRSVAPPQAYFKEDYTSDIYLFLQKQRANTLDGILGVSQTEDEGFLFTGEVNMHLQNIFQMGEELRVSWMKHEQASQYLDLRVVRPYIFGSRFGVDASLELDKIDTLYLNTDMVLGGRIYSAGNNYMRIFYQKSASSVIGKFDSIEIASYNPFSLSLIGISGHYNQLDNVFNPYRGIAVEVGAAYGEKKYLSGLVAPQYQFHSNIRGYIPLTAKTTFHLKNLTKTNYVERQERGSHYYDNEMFLWGGLNTLRGVDERSLKANWFTVLTAEYRFLFDPSSAFYVFADMGYYEKKAAEGFLSDAPVGFGLGADIHTGNGIIKINYALAKQFDNPVLLKSGKVHIGFISRF